MAEATGKYAQFDVLLPSQYYGGRRKFTPEQRLMVAVLHDVLDCVEKYRLALEPEGRRHFEEAKQWLFATEPDWPYSFQCICNALELDSGAVLQSLRVDPDSNLQLQEINCG